MTHTIKAVLLAACLTSLSPVLAAAEGGAEGEVAAVEGRYITNDEKGLLGGKLEFLLPIAAHGAVIVGIVMFFRELALGIEAKKGYDYEYDYDLAAEGYERHDANAYRYPTQGPGYSGARPARRRPARDTQHSLLTHLAATIDPVEATFSLLQVQDPDCRRRVVCEVQRSASALPLIGAFLQQLSTSIHGLHEYREAQQAGADLQDCTLLFSQCPSDTVTQDYYNY